jgi:hypothetical protein
VALFDADLEAGAELLCEAFGGSLTYVTAAGVSTSLTGDVFDERVETDNESDRRIKVRRCDAVISSNTSSTYGGIATPKLKDTVTISSVSWAIEGIRKLPGGWWQLQLVRPEPMDRSFRDGVARR